MVRATVEGIEQDTILNTSRKLGAVYVVSLLRYGRGSAVWPGTAIGPLGMIRTRHLTRYIKLVLISSLWLCHFLCNAEYQSGMLDLLAPCLQNSRGFEVYNRKMLFDGRWYGVCYKKERGRSLFNVCGTCVNWGRAGGIWMPRQHCRIALPGFVNNCWLRAIWLICLEFVKGHTAFIRRKGRIKTVNSESS